MKLLKLFAIAVAFSVSTSAMAVEAGAINERFKEYWKAFSTGQFDTAARYISPKDTQLVKTEFMPVFLDAAKSKHPDVKKQADVFFQGVPVPRRAEMSDKEAYAGLNRMIFSHPDIAKKMQGSVVSVDDVKFTSPSEATVAYTAKFADGAEGSEEERFTKIDGVWFLKLKLVPETAAKFRKALLPPKKS